jgi:hypothetical protein
VATADAYAYGNCTYYVAERFPQINAHMGNAGDWVASARRLGYTVLQQPTPGTIAVYSKSYPGSGGYGHVAVVDSLNGDGSFNVSEMNFAGWNYIDKRTVTKADQNYIIGYIVPPGTTLSQLSQQQNQTSSGPQWTFGPVSILGSDIYFDGLVGWSAMIGGGLLMLAGLTVLVAWSFAGTRAGQTAGRLLSVVPNPAAQLASRATAARAKSEPAPQETPQQQEAASKQRRAVAKSRLSESTEREVSEARAGRGKRLSSGARTELRAVQGGKTA